MRLQRLDLSVSAGVGCGTVILLPAAGQRLEEFGESGFHTALQRRGLALHLQCVGPQLSHLTDRSWIAALRSEVIDRVSAEARPLWLGGISLGAFMALRYAAAHPGEIDGLCLIAPYLGSRIVAAEIARCGSLESWQPGTPSPEDDERQVWSYIRSLRTAPIALFVGLSREDRFADTQRLLAQAVAARDCVEVPGRHEWPVWCRLWEHFLDRLDPNGQAIRA